MILGNKLPEAVSFGIWAPAPSPSGFEEAAARSIRLPRILCAILALKNGAVPAGGNPEKFLAEETLGAIYGVPAAVWEI